MIKYDKETFDAINKHFDLLVEQFDNDDLKEVLKLYKELFIENQNLQNIIKEVREYIDLVETLAINDKINIFSMSSLKRILDKGE